MGMIDRLLARFGYTKANNSIAPGFLRTGLGMGEYHPEIPDYSLARNQSELYQRLSWVMISVSNLSNAAAGVKFNVKSYNGEDEKDIPNHDFEKLLRRPNPLHSRFEFLRATSAYIPLAGNAYWWLNRPSPEAPPVESWIIPPYQIKPVPDERMYLRGYLYDPGDGSKPIPLETWEIVHFKNFHPKNRFVGMSAIEALATTAVGDMAMQKWNTNFFHKDYAKPPGALAYSSPIDDATWERMKKDLRDEHGGTERRLMVLRNVGKDGVQWIDMGLSQEDMQFLEGRNFNKEEIFAAFAPGLSSMLAVNATEANSIAGKATFMELAVWPLHQAIAEKITNDVLPAYGKDLTGEFDDVRLSDRQMELNEQLAAFKVITVKEAREKYHQLAPLGDERDNKLVDGPPEPGTMIPPQLGGEEAEKPGEKPEPPKPENAGDPDKETEGQRTSEDEPMKADIEKWRKKAVKAVKAGKTASVKFESGAIPVVLIEAIKGALEVATSIERVFAVFDNALSWQDYP